VHLHEPPQPLGRIHEGVEAVIDEPVAGVAEIDGRVRGCRYDHDEDFIGTQEHQVICRLEPHVVESGRHTTAEPGGPR
jgi:hypothetical protein